MSNYARLIEIFETLVGYRTVTGDHAAAAACLDYASGILQSAGMQVNRHMSNGYGSLFATPSGTKHPKVFLQAHIDVVPGDASLFTLYGASEKLIGRGAYDMKFAAACYLRLVEELGPQAAGLDFGVMLTSDEEDGGLNGTDYLLDQGYGCQVVLIPDGGQDWQLEKDAKGVWLVDAIASGSSAHGSRPWEGDNAALRLLEFVKATKSLQRYIEHTDTTVVLSRLLAGEARNQVPAMAKASFDIRFLDDVSLAKVQQQLTRLAEQHEVMLVTDRQSPAVHIDVSHSLLQTWLETVSAVRDKPVPEGYSLSYGSSDARFFAARGIPAIVTRPAGGAIHADGEWINEAELYEFYECIHAYVAATCGVEA